MKENFLMTKGGVNPCVKLFKSLFKDKTFKFCATNCMGINMYYSTIHTHTNYCDGNNTAEEMVIAAINKGMKSIGISTHGPLPFKAKWAVDADKVQTYIDEVNYLKEKYKDKIEVLLGMEFDYFLDIEYEHIDKSIVKQLDYFVGSIHYLGRYNDGKPWTVDASYEKFIDGINATYNGDKKAAILDYYYHLSKMVIKYKPDVVGHIDIVKKTNTNNVLFDESEDWYKKAVCDCLDKIKDIDTVIEINTGAIARGYDIEQYPSDWILEEINKRQIPITINSDAHSVEGIACEFDKMYELVKKLNISNLVYLTKDGWKKMIL